MISSKDISSKQKGRPTLHPADRTALPDDRLQELQQIATHFQAAPEELVRISIEELLSRPEEEFRKALEYVLRKNTELYQRLA